MRFWRILSHYIFFKINPQITLKNAVNKIIITMKRYLRKLLVVIAGPRAEGILMFKIGSDRPITLTVGR